MFLIVFNVLCSVTDTKSSTWTGVVLKCSSGRGSEFNAKLMP